MKSLSTLWFPALVALMLQGLFVALEVTPVLEGGLYGPDSYMRLVRVGELAEHGRWFDKLMPRSNAPFGEELHWTRFFDVLVLAGAAPLMPFLGLRSAIHWWGVALSPALQLATLAALLWAARPFFERSGRVFLCVIFVCQPAVFYPFIAGRPDHHSLMSLLFALTVGVTVRLIRRRLRAKHCLAAGALLALDLWVSVESLMPVGLVLLTLGLLWIGRGGDFARKSLLITLVVAAGSGLALLIDPPFGRLGAVVYDRLSVVHVVLFSLMALFWALAVALEERGLLLIRPLTRAGAAGLGAAVVVGGTVLAFPNFLAGPFADLDPRVVPVFHSLVEQSRPLITDNPATWRNAVYYLGPIVLGLPYLLYRCRGGDGEQRDLWRYMAGAMALFLVLTFYQLRWATYFDLLLVFPLTGLLMALLAWFNRHLRLPWRALARALAVVVFSIGFAVFGAYIRSDAGAADDDEAARGPGTCPLARFAEFANGQGTQGRPQRILANVFFGPELLYTTPHEVVAAPYPRGEAGGIWDAYLIMTAQRDEAAETLIRRRGVTWILICPDSTEPMLYRTSEPRPTFYARLVEGRHPPWLRPLALPPELAAFQLYEVEG